MRLRELRKLVEQLTAGSGGTPDIFNREDIGDLTAEEVRIPVNDDVPNQIRVVSQLAADGFAALYVIPEGGVWDDRVEIDYASSSVVCEVTLHIDSLPPGCGYAVQIFGGSTLGDVHETPIR